MVFLSQFLGETMTAKTYAERKLKQELIGKFEAEQRQKVFRPLQ